MNQPKCCSYSNSARFTIHSFREGNTRTQFVFFSQLAENAGYQLDTEAFKIDSPLRDEFVNARFYNQATTKTDRLAAVLSKAISVLAETGHVETQRERLAALRARFPELHQAGTPENPEQPEHSNSGADFEL